MQLSLPVSHLQGRKPGTDHSPERFVVLQITTAIGEGLVVVGEGLETRMGGNRSELTVGVDLVRQRLLTSWILNDRRLASESTAANMLRTRLRPGNGT